MGIRATVLLAALGLAGSISAQAATMYCCTDANGRKSCGDTLPEACWGRAYRTLGDDGRLRDVAAPLTAEQKALRDAEARRRQEEERQVLEERRRNMALLNTYSSVGEIDQARERTLQGLNRDLGDAQGKYDDIVRRKRQIDGQAQQAPSSDLAVQARAAAAELSDQQRVIDGKRQEIADVRAKFEIERKRYLELTRGGAEAK